MHHALAVLNVLGVSSYVDNDGFVLGKLCLEVCFFPLVFFEFAALTPCLISAILLNFLASWKAEELEVDAFEEVKKTILRIVINLLRVVSQLRLGAGLRVPRVGAVDAIVQIEHSQHRSVSVVMAAQKSIKLSFAPLVFKVEVHQVPKLGI